MGDDVEVVHHTEKHKWVIWLIWVIVGQYTDKMTQKYVKNESFCPCSDTLWLKWLIWVFLCTPLSSSWFKSFQTQQLYIKQTNKQANKQVSKQTNKQTKHSTYGLRVGLLPVTLTNVSSLFRRDGPTGLITQGVLIKSHDNVPRKHKTKKAVMDLRMWHRTIVQLRISRDQRLHEVWRFQTQRSQVNCKIISSIWFTRYLTLYFNWMNNLPVQYHVNVSSEIMNTPADRTMWMATAWQEYFEGQSRWQLFLHVCISS